MNTLALTRDNTMVSKEYAQARYIQACKIADGSQYAKGRMTGVCMVANKAGYQGSDLSVRLQLLTDVLASK